MRIELNMTLPSTELPEMNNVTLMGIRAQNREESRFLRIQIVSDLHLERYPDFMPQAVPGVDLLVLAGDIGSYQSGSRLRGDDFGLTRFSPLSPNAPWARVLYVPGNHEFDSLDFEETYFRLQELCTKLGIEWLDRSVIQVGDVRLIGSILWSDFDAFTIGEKTEAGRVEKREKAFRAANFYLRKNTTIRAGVPLLAEGIRELALESQAWLSKQLDVPFAGKTVVVTHFAPSLRSADPRYGHQPGTAGFCNSVDHLLAKANTWVHGHLHCPIDYVAEGLDTSGERWQCRVVANPRGYESKGEQAGFNPELIIEI